MRCQFHARVNIIRGKKLEREKHLFTDSLPSIRAKIKHFDCKGISFYFYFYMNEKKRRNKNNSF